MARFWALSVLSRLSFCILFSSGDPAEWYKRLIFRYHYGTYGTASLELVRTDGQ